MLNRSIATRLALACLGFAISARAQMATPPTPPPTPATNAMAAPANLPPATPPLAATNGISLSNYKHPLTDVRRMNRRDDPTNSLDRHFDWWPRFGTNQAGVADWIQYTFEKPATVSETKVYWFDDEARRGGCRIPVSWRLVYQDGDQWKPVEATTPYTVTKDHYDAVTFKPVTTGAVRLEIMFQDRWSVGIEAWKVK